jgi:hypothetical protein
LNLGDTYFGVPILLDEYNNILDVTEGTLGCVRNHNSAGEGKKGGAKKNHFDFKRNGVVRKRVIYILPERRYFIQPTFASPAC